LPFSIDFDRRLYNTLALPCECVIIRYFPSAKVCLFLSVLAHKRPCPFLWLPYVIGQTIIFLPCDFYLTFFLFFYSSPNLSGRRLDVYHTTTHGVALVRSWNAGLKPAARGSLKTQDAKKSPKIAIWAPSHNFFGLYLHN